MIAEKYPFESLYGKFPYWDIFYANISVQWIFRKIKFPTAKFLYNEISLRRVFLTAEFPYGESSDHDMVCVV